MVGTSWLSIIGLTTPCKAGFPVTLVWMVRRFGDASVLNRRLLEIGSCGLVFGSEVFALEFYSRILSWDFYSNRGSNHLLSDGWLLCLS